MRSFYETERVDGRSGEVTIPEAMLALFSLNSNTMLTHDFILTAIWENPLFVLPNTYKTRINNVRKMLPPDHTIINVRGFGYAYLTSMPPADTFIPMPGYLPLPDKRVARCEELVWLYEALRQVYVKSAVEAIGLLSPVDQLVFDKFTDAYISRRPLLTDQFSVNNPMNVSSVISDLRSALFLTTGDKWRITCEKKCGFFLEKVRQAG